MPDPVTAPVTTQPVTTTAPAPEAKVEGTQTPATTTPAPETKTETNPPKTEAKTEQKPAVPEKYELTLPAGTLLKPAALEEIAARSKERGLTQEQAQADVERESKIAASVVEEQKIQFNAQVESWKADVQKDPELGGEKANEVAEHAKRFINRFGSPQLVEDLNKTGLGNHPELVRMIYRAEMRFANDKTSHPGSGGASGKVERAADVLYPNQNKP